MLHALHKFIIILNNPLSLVVQHSWFSLRLYAEKSTCIYMDICMENQLQLSPTPTSSCFKQQWQTIKPYKHGSANILLFIGSESEKEKTTSSFKQLQKIHPEVTFVSGVCLIFNSCFCFFFVNCFWDLDATCPLLLCGKGEAAHQYTDQYTVTQKFIFTLK